MKKIVLLLLLILVLGNVNAVIRPTIVNGHVYFKDTSHPVKDALVKVTCNGQTLYDTTNAQGYYVVEFMNYCDVGSRVRIESNNVVEYGIVKASRVMTKNIVYVNLEIPRLINNHQLHDLSIKSVVLEDYSITKSKDLVAYVRFKNEGLRNEEDVKIRVTIPELGIIDQQVTNNLDMESQKLRIFTISIPRNTKPGNYALQVKVFNEYSKEIEEVEFKVR